ncbi:MAG TPA: aldo/keto reductase [Acidimicrobiales bacterium]|nr:aldo/keto reductase [Acidimicrobiales bacterium]
MRYVEAGGVRLSAVGLGTWQFGSGEWGYGTAYATEMAPRIVDRSLDLGVNLVDTAEAYGFGRSETIVGRALAGRRAEAFVATKLLPVLPVGPIVGWRARASQRRLDVEAIDLYQLHWPNPAVPVRLTADALAGLQRSGLIRHVGVSNFSLARWQGLERALGGPVLSNQVRFSLIDRGPEAELLPWAQANDRLLIAYSPLSQGLLSGRYDPDHLPSGLRASTPPFLPGNIRLLAPVLGALREVAAGHRATPAQVALAWLLRRPNVVVIPGASSVEQAESNAAAADLVLTDGEDAALTAASDHFHPVRGTAALPAVARRRVDRSANRVRRAVGGLRG